MRDSSVKNYILVTGAYWAFTLTDGALRMLVLLYFHQLGYTPIEIASLFLFYEFFGIVTNLVGGWIASHLGLRVTLLAGLALQVFALVILSQVGTEWQKIWAVAYVMLAQALSGIAKDLTKMSAKSAIKYLIPDSAQGRLFRWVALLTGSKNALKGAGFFLGGALLSVLGFSQALISMAVVLLLIIGMSLKLPQSMGKSQRKQKFRQLFSKSQAINVLSGARFFLFGARDIWFVIGLPLFLSSELGWSHTATGAFLAAWVIGYGIVQSSTPGLIKHYVPSGKTATYWVGMLALNVLLLALLLYSQLPASWVITLGLAVFGIIFAINSSIHSYLIIAYADHDNVTTDVGFYYMANAAGRLAGTLLSGMFYQQWGLSGCLWASLLFLVSATLISRTLPHEQTAK